MGFLPILFCSSFHQSSTSTVLIFSKFTSWDPRSQVCRSTHLCDDFKLGWVIDACDYSTMLQLAHHKLTSFYNLVYFLYHDLLPLQASHSILCIVFRPFPSSCRLDYSHSFEPLFGNTLNIYLALFEKPGTNTSLLRTWARIGELSGKETARLFIGHWACTIL